MDEVVAGREVGDAVLELVDVEVVERGQVGGGAVEPQLGLGLDAAPQAAAVPALLPAPQELAPGLAEGVEGADHHEVAHRAGADGAAAQAVDEVVEGFVGAVLAFGDDGLASVLAQVAHVVEPDAHGVLGLNRQGSTRSRNRRSVAPWSCRLGVGTLPGGGWAPRWGVDVAGAGGCDWLRQAADV